MKYFEPCFSKNEPSELVKGGQGVGPKSCQAKPTTVFFGGSGD